MTEPDDKRMAKADAAAEKARARVLNDRPFWKKKRFMLPLAVIALLMVALLTVDPADDTADLAEGTEDSEENTTEAAEEQQASEAAAAPEEIPAEASEADDLPAPIQVGETGSFADWDYRVITTESMNTIGDETARGSYIVVLAEFTNNADVPRAVGTSFGLFNDTGQTYEMDSTASLSHHHTYAVDEWHLEDIGPGFTARIPIVFDVPNPVGPWGFFFFGRDQVGPPVTFQITE